MRNVAIVLAAGSGKRMQSDVKKQYMELEGKPVLYYCMNVFENSPLIDEIVLVTSEEDIAYCKEEIVERFGFTKVKQIVVGGKERYNSVMNGMDAIDECGCVLVHDGARPFVDEAMLERLIESVKENKTAVAAMPSKDTVKIVDNKNVVISTPNRSTVWNIQTPQAFDFVLIRDAYERMKSRELELLRMDIKITDDAMVAENFTNAKVQLVEGSYRNIKITTPEDMMLAEMYLKMM